MTPEHQHTVEGWLKTAETAEFARGLALRRGWFLSAWRWHRAAKVSRRNAEKLRVELRNLGRIWGSTAK